MTYVAVTEALGGVALPQPSVHLFLWNETS
jgi:hypothetical protein